MKKIGELSTRSALFVLYYDEKDRHHNHYKLYQRWYSQGWHRKLIEAYGDLYSCTIWINDYVSRHNEDNR